MCQGEFCCLLFKNNSTKWARFQTMCWEMSPQTIVRNPNKFSNHSLAGYTFGAFTGQHLVGGELTSSSSSWIVIMLMLWEGSRKIQVFVMKPIFWEILPLNMLALMVIIIIIILVRIVRSRFSGKYYLQTCLLSWTGWEKTLPPRASPFWLF